MVGYSSVQAKTSFLQGFQTWIQGRKHFIGPVPPEDCAQNDTARLLDEPTNGNVQSANQRDVYHAVHRAEVLWGVLIQPCFGTPLIRWTFSVCVSGKESCLRNASSIVLPHCWERVKGLLFFATMSYHHPFCSLHPEAKLAVPSGVNY